MLKYNNIAEYFKGWTAQCRQEVLDIKNTSKDYQRGYFAAWEYSEGLADDPLGMVADLQALRRGDVKSLAKLPDEMIEAIEDEEIGRIFCTHPSYRAW